MSRIILESGNELFYDIRGSQAIPPVKTPEEDKKIRTEYLDGDLVRQEYIREILSDKWEIHLTITNIHCSACVWLNEKVLNQTPGIRYSRINYATGRAEIHFDPGLISLSRIFEAIESIGYLPRLYSPWTQNSQQKKNKSLLIRMGVAGFFFGNIMLFGTALYAGYFSGIEMEYKRLLHYLSWFLATPVYFYSGYPFLQGAWMGLKNKRFSMDFLLVTGISLAYFYSIYVTLTDRGEVYFDSVCMIYFFILLGKYLEDNARIRAGDKLTGLLASIPEVATIQETGGEERVVRTSEIKKNMVVLIRTGERVPIDGVLESDLSFMDESFLTGESDPLTKKKGDSILAGSINTGDPISLIAETDSKNSTLSRLKIIIEKAMGEKPQWERITDRISGYFITIVFLIAIGTFIYWNYLTNLGLESSLVNTIAVLIVACPCALGLAVPTALVMNHIRNSKEGVIIKNPDSIETLSQISQLFLDKTGTITEGKSRLTNHSFNSLPLATSLTWALETFSHHPIAKNLVMEMENLSRENPNLHLTSDIFLSVKNSLSQVREIPGKGMQAIWDISSFDKNHSFSSDMMQSIIKEDSSDLSSNNSPFADQSGRHISIRLGSPGFLGVDPPLKFKTQTTIHLAINNTHLGFWVLEDRLRNSTKHAISELQKIIPQITLLSGDQTSVVERMAGLAEIPSFQGEVSPEKKLETIEFSQKQGKTTAMVGDGINDSAALAKADIGISMGIAADLSLDKSDVILVKNDLQSLVMTIKYAKETRKRIRENLVISFLYNSVMLPLAAMGLMAPVICAVFMALSSLTVVGNSLRLKSR